MEAFWTSVSASYAVNTLVVSLSPFKAIKRHVVFLTAPSRNLSKKDDKVKNRYLTTSRMRFATYQLNKLLKIMISQSKNDAPFLGCKQ